MRNILKFLIPLCCGIAIFWALYSRLDIEQITRILQSEIKYGWIILSMIVGVVSHIVRAMRWQLQLRALGNPVSFRTLTNAIFGTYCYFPVWVRFGVAVTWLVARICRLRCCSVRSFPTD